MAALGAVRSAEEQPEFVGAIPAGRVVPRLPQSTGLCRCSLPRKELKSCPCVLPVSMVGQRLVCRGQPWPVESRWLARRWLALARGKVMVGTPMAGLGSWKADGWHADGWPWLVEG